ncbi:hypothetical protein [Aliarcobacter butzleri]|uniref:hypothetical protein n=1 Tax=Aliarcobacter butzleri TaxID=28197 RepID=UPI003207F589
MLKNMNMRKKLFLFPLLFILIVIGSGLEIEHKIQEINKNAIMLREDAYKSLDIDLVILAIVATSIFILLLHR